MHELRRCPLTRRWTVIAPSRVRRPDVFKLGSAADPDAYDPFEEGHEDATPGEILAYRKPGTAADGPGWTLRVVPNKFPALRVEDELTAEGRGLYDLVSGVGAHEVIIECPHRESRTAKLSEAAVFDTLRAYRERLDDLRRDGRLKHAVVFKNTGALAGASLDHVHSQLVAAPFVGPEIQTRLDSSAAHHADRGRDLLGDLAAQELRDGERVVAETPHFAAYCPYASRFSFETWVVPRFAGAHYHRAPADRLREMAGLLKSVLARLDAAVGEPPFNYVLHTAPFAAEAPGFRWHLEILPRLSRAAGFEWGTGAFINAVPPEAAAKAMREAA